MKTRLRAVLLPLCILASSIAPSATQLAPVAPPPVTATLLLPPDPCWSNQLQLSPVPWPSQDLTVLGETARVFEAGPSSNSGPPPRRHDASLRPLVLVVDGNGFGLSDYDDLAGYLAVKGFNVVVIDRPSQNGPDPVEYALAAIEAAFTELGLPAGAPVGVIGHSVGGSIAIDTVVENHSNAGDYNIEALVLLAPKVSNGSGTLISANQLPALLTVYGSQDNDVGGLTDALTDGFSAYDRAGTESSTTCHQPLCNFQAQMHRTMVYIHGADHAGLVNQEPGLASTGSSWDPFNSYLARTSQFCIAKGYTLAMLEWTLDDNTAWKSMVHGGHVPSSIQAMTTASADELGNPAGSPLRLALQVSPKKRSVIENFEDGGWDTDSQTEDVVVQLATEGEYAGGALNVRHATKLGIIAWPERDDWQLVGFAVPGSKRDVTGFTHLILRVGQLAGVADATLANPANTPMSLLIGVSDGGASDWEWSHAHDAIPPADRRPNGQHQSVMSTLRIPLSAFSNIDESEIESVLVAFPAGTQGTLLIDSLEWVKE